MGLAKFFGCGRRPSEDENQVNEVKQEEVQNTPKSGKKEEGERKSAYSVPTQVQGGSNPTPSTSNEAEQPQPAPTRVPQPRPPADLPEGIRPLPEKRNMASWRSASATPALGTSGAPGSSTRGKPRTMFMQPANSDMIFTKSKHAQEKEADIASAILPFSKKEPNQGLNEDDSSVFVQSKHERMGEELLPGMLN